MALTSAHASSPGGLVPEQVFPAGASREPLDDEAILFQTDGYKHLSV